MRPTHDSLIQKFVLKRQSSIFEGYIEMLKSAAVEICLKNVFFQKFSFTFF